MAETQDFQVQRATPADVERLGQMLDTVYRPWLTPGEGMPKEFPHLFCAENAHHLYYVEEDGNPVSMIATLPQKVVMQGIAVDVVSIGSVVTIPQYQGRQISSAILDRVVTDWAAAGIPLMLVSGDRGLYRRIHCTSVGSRLEVIWNGTGGEQHRLHGQSAATDVINKGQRIVEIQATSRADWAPRLAPLYRAEAYRYRRTDAQMATLMNALWFARDGYSQRLFVILQGETVSAYVIAYQALKSPETVEVMEWAGSRVAVIDAFNEILSAFDANHIRFYVHQSDRTMQSLVEARGLDYHRIPLQGTIRILDIPAVFRVLAPIFAERFGSEAVVQQDGSLWKVQVGEHLFATESLGELTSFVFDSGKGKLGIEFVHTDDLNYI
ncbi:GNAT family N-acetyltransferase [Alicyclobacillus sp. SO9]|uniref:GNAT family N-acetyltransferase n=1 Tax=Alicyclobacillus sp. SO9 TaxID=2665646 RepID=UPI0018E72C93|nr:GNAT family N-acetyltransferase [Alicyclobacillus sp. SO9]QQE79192.1 GNAT family N-acetyltransferase [Alicyclobacillus sp. SO9]